MITENKQIKVGMVSLGCPKNQIDAEIMLSLIKNASMEIASDENKADVIIVNTCGFIEDAKKESIENILEIAELKKQNLKALIVTGCMAERYREEIQKELSEVDAIIGIGKNSEIVQLIENALNGEKICCHSAKTNLPLNGDRVLSTPFYTAYIKIAEGCDNRCSYCAIPMIRGAFRSREIKDIILEAKQLAENGVKELVLVAQDTTRYGEDLYGKLELPHLLKKLCEIDKIQWIRILYAYPDKITDELLDVMAEHKKIVNYLDMPVQHCDSEILKAMNRKGDMESLLLLVKKMREKMPDITLRTTLIAGFPGESEKQFETLCEFVKKAEFERLGCFAYSPEEDTLAASFENQIDEETKNRRKEIIMTEQYGISERKNRQKIGTKTDILVEGYDGYIKHFFGRSPADAPDIDGKVFFTGKIKYSEGSFASVLITDVLDYDLLGEALEDD